MLPNLLGLTDENTFHNAGFTSFLLPGIVFPATRLIPADTGST